jgi:Skp family chaperone for outer membrane proteins
MIKTFTAALVLGAATGALAQGAAPAAARTPHIAIIDMGRISSESLLGKSFATQIEALRKQIDDAGTKKQQDLDKLDADLKALSDDLEKQGSVLSAEAADRKRQEIVGKQRARQAFLEDGQAELARMKERATQQAQQLNAEFQTRVKPLVEAVAKEKGIDILLDSQVALTVSNDFDVTADVITRLDKTDTGARPAAAKPAAAPARPAAAPSPKPAPKKP